MTRRIEPIWPAAAGPIAVLHRACFPEDPWGVGVIEQVMRIPGFFGRIGWMNNDPAGFALALDLGGECEILSLGVLADQRRAGIGSGLLDSICREAARRGGEWVVLEAAADNDAARALYAGRGFTVVGRRCNYYRQAGRLVDALILRLGLPANPLAT
jgi:[ribosomal protein S18]-alanine N-acetyltransferase